MCPAPSSHHAGSAPEGRSKGPVRASMSMLLCAGCAYGVELDPQTSVVSTGFGGNEATTATPPVVGSYGGSFGGAGPSSGGATGDGAAGGTGASSGADVADSAGTGGGAMGHSLLDHVDVAQDGRFDGSSGLPPGGTIGSCDPTKWSVSASTSAPADLPTNAIDGNPVTRWSTGTGQAFGQYYQIDFSGYVSLREIVLDNTGSPGDHPRGYRVEISNDAIDFSNVIASGALLDTAPPLVFIDFPAQAVRLLRIELLTSSGSWWSIHELHTICQVPGGDGGG